MTDAARNPDNYCYRHPDRQSFVLCQRCGRTICPECQTQAAVGVHCPECVREARQSSPRGASVGKRASRILSSSGGRPIVTFALMGISIIVFLIELLTGGEYGQFASILTYQTTDVIFAPWTLVTANFVHGNILHILFNMYSLYVLSPALERLLGRGRYLALFLVSALGGWVAVDLIAPGAVIGASAGIFGLLGALFVIQRRMGGNSTQLIIVIVLNLAIGFFVPGLAWQAHIGGVLVGALIGFVYLETRDRSRRRWQILAMVGIVVVLVAASIIKSLLLLNSLRG